MAEEPASQRSGAPLWRDARFIAAVSAVLMALASGVTGWAANRSTEGNATRRTDHAYDRVAAELRQNARGDAQLADDVRRLRAWLEIAIARQQVSSPVPGATGTAAAAPSVVVVAAGEPARRESAS